VGGILDWARRPSTLGRVKRLLLPGLVACGALALVALLVFGVANQRQQSSLDDQVARGQRPAAPAPPLQLLSGGGRRSLADFRGRVVVLNVFASWCQPCETEAPALEREQRSLSARGATVLGVTYNDNADDTARFVRRLDLSYPVLRDPDGLVAGPLAVHGVPETFVIDRRGRIAAIRRGAIDRDFLLRTVAPLLASRS